MSEVMTIGDSQLPALPRPRTAETIRIRPGVLSDFAFIDDLQKRQRDGVGFMWKAAIEGHLRKGNVLIAEATPGNPGSPGSPENPGSPGSAGSARANPGSAEAARGSAGGVALSGGGRQEIGAGAAGLGPAPTALPPTPVGYVLGADRYLKRDELGIIYQMNVEPAYQRSLVAANLLRAKFDASAYGCRLYCCWCAQDLAANYFWEAMGFVPLAFRTGGGRGKTKKDGKFRGRMHIFWQKRIRPGRWDEAAGAWVEDDFPYWFPSLTGAGAIGEDRIVLPIPPGTHWSDAKPIVLPEGSRQEREAVKQLESEVARLEREKKDTVRRKQREAAAARAKAAAPATNSIESGGLRFGPAPEVQRAQAAEAARDAEIAAAAEAEISAVKRRVKAAKKKFDPAQEAFARELKDRWLEQVLAEPGLLAPVREKYAVGRRIEAGGFGAEAVGSAGMGGAGGTGGAAEVTRSAGGVGDGDGGGLRRLEAA